VGWRRDEEGLHGAKSSISKGAAKALGSVAGLVSMLLVEEGVERSVE
jgi:hypothetical protein